MDIVYQDNKHYLSKSMSFSSPSAAACFVLGASANGWTEWKDKSGRTLDELFHNGMILCPFFAGKRSV
ncbi:MAG: DUF4357 domain-containing protein [Butyricicoccus sp.]